MSPSSELWFALWPDDQTSWRKRAEHVLRQLRALCKDQKSISFGAHYLDPNHVGVHVFQNNFLWLEIELRLPPVRSRSEFPGQWN